MIMQWLQKNRVFKGIALLVWWIERLLPMQKTSRSNPVKGQLFFVDFSTETIFVLASKYGLLKCIEQLFFLLLNDIHFFFYFPISNSCLLCFNFYIFTLKSAALIFPFSNLKKEVVYELWLH
jgi:hypothetical protein